jgi:hypothetical protein
MIDRHLFKGTTRLKVPLREAKELLTNANKRLEWDPLLASCELLESRDDGSDVIYLKYDYHHLPAFRWIWPRIFCVHRYSYQVGAILLFSSLHYSHRDVFRWI